MLDTACPSQICNSLQDLRETRRLKPREIQLRVGNGDSLQVEAVGILFLKLSDECNIKLNNCYFMPTMIRQIISLPVLDSEGFHVNIKDGLLNLYDNMNVLLVSCPMVDGHYILTKNRDVFNIEKSKRKRSEEINNTELWHMRLGHIGIKCLTKLVKDGVISDLTIEPLPVCEYCIQGKMTKSSFSGVGHRANDLLELVHSDVCGPINHAAMGGFQYFVTFIDDLSRYGYVFLRNTNRKLLKSSKNTNLK